MKDKLVEECLKNVSDCFLLIVLASHLASELASGSISSTVSRKNQYWIMALKEIAYGNVDIKNLKERVIESHQHFRFLSHET